MNIYQENYIESLKEKEKMMDYEAWLYGQYQAAAISAAMNKKNKYPRQPVSFQEENSEQLSGEEQFILWIDQFNRRFTAEK